jgi:Papain-like cysteine protease AvrRpt2
MIDELEILGLWQMKFKQWIWDYRFSESRNVTWRDIYNGKTGTGQWMLTDKLINIKWNGSTTKESWYRPINPDNQEGWLDGYTGVGKFTAKRLEKYEPGAMSLDYSVGAVPVFLQGNKPLCWSAAVAMMLAWRFRTEVNSVAKAMAFMGEPYVALHRKGRPLNQKNFDDEMPDFMVGWNVREHYGTAARLKHEPLRSYSPKQLCELMARYRSPLLVEAFWDRQWTHDYVVKRIYGNGRLNGTTVVLNDPNSGEDEMLYEDFIEKVEGVADRIDIQIWHF